MARRSVKAAPDASEAEVAVPKTRKKRDKKDDKAMFRSPHAGLEVVVHQPERVDLGAGSYSIAPPKTVKFENMGSYGECVCEKDVAEVLRRKAKDRADKFLPPKYAEVEDHVESHP